MPRPTIRGSGIPTGNAVEVGPHLLVHAQYRRSDEVPTSKRAVTIARSSSELGIDVLDAVDALDDGLERLGNELDRILRL